MQLLKYEDFISRVNELGFMFFSNVMDGMPSLVSETPYWAWHTGDPETDPWRWKDRAAEEKRLAFGCVLGGNKGFIAPHMYAVFLAACKPSRTMRERRYEGLVSQACWDLWQLFEWKKVLDTSEIRSHMGVRGKKSGSSKVDSAIVELQKQFYITVGGSRQKIDRNGRPYGWHINVYERVEDWAPAQWCGGKQKMDREDAVDLILDTGMSIGKNVDRDKLAKVLGLSL